MTKTIFIILTLAGFASGAEFEVTDKLSVVSTAVFSGSVGIGTTGPQGTLHVRAAATDAIVVSSTTGNVGIGTTTPGSRLSVLGSTDTAYSLAVGTSTNYSLTISTGGNAQFSGTIFQGTYTVLNSSMLDSFTLKLDTTTNKIKLADRIEQNIMLDAFKIAVSSSLSIFNMVDGIMDEFEDEIGVDTTNSIGQTYNLTDDYYSPSPADGTGGTITHSGGKTIHTFTSDGTFVPPAAGNVAVLVVGGGGGGGSYGGGGGGGGVVYNSNLPVTDAIFVYVGDGGSVGISVGGIWGGGVGGNSVFSTITGAGGGGGGGNGVNGDNGGCGGGGGFTSTYGTGSPGYNGGSSLDSGGGVRAFGGGGGMNVAGGNATTVGGKGGDGIASSISGTSVIYGGGGGGSYDARYSGGNGSGGSGGGGDGGAAGGSPGVDGLGGGGGGGGYTSGFGAGGKGGKGVVIVSYGAIGVGNMELISSAAIAEAKPSHVRIVLFEQDVDAITVNTDIKAYVSINSGANYDTVTLSDEGNYNSSIRILSGTVDVSTRTGTNIKWKVTTHNAKNLKLHGVGLSWD